MISFGCFRCRHVWFPRQKKVYICPKCKSAKWNVPKQEKS